MWDLIVSVPDHCLSFYFIVWFHILLFRDKNIKEIFTQAIMESNAITTITMTYIAPEDLFVLEPQQTNGHPWSCDTTKNVLPAKNV